MITKKDIFNRGKDHGYGIATWLTIPEIGDFIPEHTLPNFTGYIEDIHDLEEVYFETCGEAESNSRQFSPFEFTAQMLNSFQDENGNYVYPDYDQIVKGVDSKEPKAMIKIKKKQLKELAEMPDDGNGDLITIEIYTTTDPIDAYNDDYRAIIMPWYTP